LFNIEAAENFFEIFRCLIILAHELAHELINSLMKKYSGGGEMMTPDVAAKAKGFRCHINAKSQGILRQSLRMTPEKLSF